MTPDIILTFWLKSQFKLIGCSRREFDANMPVTPPVGLLQRHLKLRMMNLHSMGLRWKVLNNELSVFIRLA